MDTLIASVKGNIQKANEIEERVRKDEEQGKVKQIMEEFISLMNKKMKSNLKRRAFGVGFKAKKGRCSYDGYETW